MMCPIGGIMSSSRFAATTLVYAGLLSVNSLSAQEFSRLDAFMLLNQDAPNWMLGFGNPRLSVDFLRLPRANGEPGKACGAIVPSAPRIDPNAFRSYTATLWIENGQLVVSRITPFFKSSDELLADDLCR